MRQLYFALSQANQAILRIRQEPALLRKICDIASEFGEFPLVWIGVRVPGGHELSIAARSGPEADYLDEITVSTDPESPFGRGQTGAAIRSGAPVVSNHLQRDPFMSPWREGARRHGFAASAAFPFRRAGQVAGALMVYSHHPGCFDLEGVALLGEIVDSLSFALDAMDAEAARQAAEEKFARIFQLCPDAIDLSQLEDGVSCDHNESYNRLYGYSREELAGRSTLPGDLGIWLSKEDRDRHIDLLKAQGTVRDYEAIQRRKDGSRFHASVSSTRLEIQGRAYNLTISRDITERKRLERERQQAQKMESLGTLAGGIAHDMNNVLGAILALASTSLSQLSAASPCRRSFETIAKAAERGGDMVRRLLSFARQTAHGDSPVDLNELCRDVVRLLEHTTLSSIHLRLELAGGLHPVRGDAAALSNALTNLCVNAVDAMPRQGTLTLRTANSAGDRVRLEVEDTGTGMPREILDRALDPFFTTKEHGRGTGLGLSLVYATVQAHGGQLHIHSDPGHGTRVALSFPSCAPAPAPAAQAPEPPASPGKAALTVLVVDDDELIQASMGELLRALGHHAVVTGSGEAALARLEQGLEPDVAILDVNMPGLGGRGTLPRLRALRPALPVLLATGRPDQAVLDLLAADPDTTLLCKPFTLKDLRDRLGSRPAAAEPPGLG